MTDAIPERSVLHSTFLIERTYNVAPAKVFAAFASQDAKRRWFAGPDPDLQLDFRVGGKEVSIGGPPAGPVYKYEAHYQDIITNRRIVYTYNMWMDDDLISVSVATIDLTDEGKGSTKLTFTEQGAFLDGKDKPADREEGTREMLVKELSAFLKAN